MTTEEAIEWYYQLTGIKYPTAERASWPKDYVRVLNNILDTARMIEYAGGTLKSRQAIAVIIQLSKLEAKLLE